jgi:hypothetical protein
MAILWPGDGCNTSCQIECGWEYAGGTQTEDVCFAVGCGDQMLGGEEECRSQAVRSSGSWFSRFSRLMEERECCLLVLNLVSSTLAVAVEGRRQRGAVVHFRGFSNLNGSSN